MLREWGISVAAAGILVFYDLAFAAPFSGPFQDKAVGLWERLVGLSQSFNEGVGSLAGLVALPVTFFIAVALSDVGVIATRWTVETRAWAARLLRWSSRAVSVASWCFIPSLVVLGTPVLGILIPLACQILCAYCAAMAVTQRTSTTAYEAYTARIEELEERRSTLMRTLERRPIPVSWWVRFMDTSWGAITMAALLVFVSLVPALTFGEMDLDSFQTLVVVTPFAVLLPIPMFVVGGATRVKRSAITVSWMVVMILLMIPGGILGAAIGTDGETSTFDSDGFIWLLWVLPFVVGFVVIFSSPILAERFGWLIPTRIAALDKEISRLERIRSQEKQLIDAQMTTAGPEGENASTVQ
jgi:hypothetical protein